MAKANRKQHPPGERLRQHRSEVRRRLAAYPVRDWTDNAALPDAESYVEWVANEAEDFPGITRAQFIQDLHRIARDATQRAAVDGEELGYVVRTSVLHLPNDEVSFCFFRRPLIECPTARGTHTTAAGGITTPPTVASRERAADWDDHRRQAYYCTTPERGTHVIGQDSGCPSCADRAPEILPDTPPKDWSPA